MIKYVSDVIHSYVEKSIYICIGGSRMCGYESEESDYDFFVIHQDQHHYDAFTLPRFIHDDKEISIRLESLDYVKKNAIKGNIKLIEKLHSNLIWKTTIEAEKLKREVSFIKEHLLLNNYCIQIQRDIDLFEENNDVKALLYAYRRCLTSLFYIRTKNIIIHSKNLLQLTNDALFLELVTLKKEKKERLASEELKKEAAYAVKEMMNEVTQNIQKESDLHGIISAE